MKFTILLFALSAMIVSSLAAPVPQGKISYIGLDVPDDAVEQCTFSWPPCLLLKILPSDLTRGIIGKIPNGPGGPESRHKRDGTMEFDVDLCILKKRAA